MSFNSDYAKLRKKRLEEQQKQIAASQNPKDRFISEYSQLPYNRLSGGDIDDIGPVATPTTSPTNDEEKKNSWFTAGAFEDGYQFGDVTKTILGTVTDVTENLYSGILGMGEKAVDGVAGFVGSVGGMFGADEFKDNVGAFIEKDLYDEEKISKILARSPMNSAAGTISAILGIEADENSVLGEKTDSLAQSGGELLGTIGLQAVGVPWYVTTGVTSFGGAMESSLNEGATFEEAGLSATVTMGAEILTEKLFGGSGLGEKGLINLEPLTKGISNKVVKALADLGVDMAAEGSEEVVSSVFSRLGSSLYKEESLDELLLSEEAVDEYIDSFIGGAVLGGVMNTGKTAKTINTGRDYRTGLTENEQKVFDRVYNGRLAEAEKNGQELTKKQKAELYDSVLNDVQKGYVSTDTIEEVLGGETYKSYKDTIDSEEAILKEYEELGKKQNATLAEQARYAELQAQVKEIQSNSKRSKLKAQLSNEVYNSLTRKVGKDGKRTQTDNFLLESYNEQARRGKAFESDLSQYKGTAAETVKKAAESGILNNTRRTHEFVDMVAKISADKGVLFDFTNNAKLKESGFAINGATVNGYVTKDGISVNIDSHKSLNSVVGHEISHVLEGTELYTEMRTALFEYAKSKKDYDSRRKSLEDLYKNVEGADIDAELTADLVGDYLFTDADFINNLSTKHRNVFQKIYDEIKYLLKIATAGSKEARELEKVKRAFDKAYKESGKAQGDTKYSLSETTDGKFVAVVENDILSNIDTSSWDKAKKDEAKKAASDALKKFTKGIVVDGITRKVNRTSRREYTRSKDTKWLYKNAPDVFADKMRAADVVDDIVVATTDWSRDGGLTHPRDDNFVDFDHGTTLILSGNAKYSAEVVVGITNTGEAVFYDVVDMTPTTFDIKKEESSTTATTQSAIGDIQEDSSVDILPQNSEKSRGNTKFSLSSDGKQLTKEQSEYFKDSKMRDENGNLKVMYHGSQDAGFHEFNTRYSDDDTSFFFVDSNDVAASYSGTSETYEAQTIRTAEDMNNFIESIGAEGYEVVEKDGKFTLLYEGDRVADSKTAKGIYEEFCWYEGVGEGDANYKVYLNLTNPLEVDAGGRNWNNISREFSQEVYDRYKSLTTEEKAALSNLAEWGEYSIFRDEMLEARATAEQGGSGMFDAAYTKNLARAYEKLGGANANLYDAFSIAQENFSEESLKEFAVKQMNTRDYAKKAKAEGYDGVIFKNLVDVGGYGNGSEGASTVAIAFESNQIKSVANEKPTKNADIRYSLSNPQTDKDYLSAAKNGDIATAQRIVEDVAKESGYAIRAYHGTARGDRVGNVFLPERATSGPMAFFTDNREIAENYSKSKQDTSMAYDPDYDRYETQFRIKTKTQDMPLYRAWGFLPFDARNRITTKAGQLHENWDGDYELILDPTTNEAGGGFQWQLKEARGNAIQALTEQWLNSGNLFNDEARFLDVLEMAGVTEEFKKIGMDTLYFKDPNAKHEKVYDTFLKITNPLDTSTVDNEFVDGLEAWYEEQDEKQYKRESMHSDLWDKNSIDAYDFAERLRRDIENGTSHAWTSIPDSVTDYIKSLGYDGIKDVGGKNGGIGHTVWIPFSSEQVKSAEPITYDDSGNVIPLSERFNEDNNDIRYSISPEGEIPKRYGNYNVYGKDVRLEAPTQEDVAPVAETVDNVVDKVVANAEQAENVLPDDIAPMSEEEFKALQGDSYLQDLEREYEALSKQIRKAYKENDTESINRIGARMDELNQAISRIEADDYVRDRQRIASLDDTDVPPEMEAPYYEEDAAPSDPFEERDIKEVGNRKVKAYMYENPEVKPFFQEEANVMLGELRDTTKGERWYNDEVYYESGGEYGWGGTQRHTSDDIAYLLDTLGYSYAEIEKGLNAIIEDNGKENNACSKRIEFILNDRLLNGYKDFTLGYDVQPNQDYINLINEKQIIEYTEEAKKRFFETADDFAPPAIEDDIAPIAETAKAPKIEKPIEDIAPTFDTKKKGEIEGQQTMFEEAEAEKEPPKVAKILTDEPEAPKKKNRAFTQARASVLDKGAVIEDLSLKTGNRELQGKYNYMHYSEARAQKYIADNLKPIVEKVERSGKTEQLYEYVYHLHNIDRMSLETEENRVKREALREKLKGYSDKQIEAIAMEWIKRDTPKDVAERIKAAREYIDASKGKNKPVFGDSVTADVSRETVKKLEAENPEFKELSETIIDYNNQLRKMLVDGNIISQETADLWAKMYPHYVPIRRLGDDGLSVNVPLDTNKTGVNAPIKRAKGGNRDIMPLFDTMAMRTEQTFKAIAKNSFGTELMHTLGSVVQNEDTNLNEVIDSFDNHEELLQKGKNGKNPTFTVFENGKKVTFEITEDIYDSLKPTSKGLLSYTNKVANTASEIFRKILTEYNPVFMVSNAAKDIQDVLINSQHAGKTYANIPRAIKELTTKGKWYTEYIENGGEQNSYFDSETHTFKKENKGFVKAIGMPLRAISEANNFIERVPRLAEYIASREAGASVEVAMLDAARVTTNFAAGGDVTKLLNRNGATFLNASIQGFNQQVRNVREAKANGLKGWVSLASKVALAGLPAILLNNLLWDDDEEYEELSEYVKDNYYVIAKTENGKFIRIPKGRALAVIQDAFEQVGNALTGDDEVDLENFRNLVISNLAPNNPFEDNILAPIIQVANNETWYGEDLVPTRLQDLPKAEQYDESTDSISKWLGEKQNVLSPYQINYLLNQYSGGVGDVLLPMITPEAESGDNSLVGNITAPMKDKFTTDSVMNNKNVSDFYDTMDVLTTNAKSSKATDEDVLKYKYFNSVNSKLGELYAQKREIQSSDLPDDEKYEAVRELQEQINSLAKESLDTYENVYIDGGYATVGDQHYRWYEPGEDSDAEAGWQKISDKQYEKQEDVTSDLDIAPSDYWSNKSEYDFAYEYPEKYAVAKSVGGYEAYKSYSSELYDIKADKDEYGKSISGSRKEKVIEYVNNLDINYGARLILFKNEYNADDTYNYEIIDYLNSREDISFEEMAAILRELGFTVSSDGTITWD